MTFSLLGKCTASFFISVVLYFWCFCLSLFFNAYLNFCVSSAINPGMDRRKARLSRRETSEELPELKEVPGEVPGITVQDVDGVFEDSVQNEEEEAGGKRKTAQEEAAEKEKEAQRQIMAIKELVDTEGSYLKHLQICTFTIRGNLQKLQVGLILALVLFFFLTKLDSHCHASCRFFVCLETDYVIWCVLGLILLNNYVQDGSCSHDNKIRILDL